MTRRSFAIAFILSISLWILTGSARSASIVVESLESAIADSDLVVHGKLAEIKRVRDKNKVIWSTVTVEVVDVIKGEKPEKLTFIAAHENEPASNKLGDLVDMQIEAIICLVKSDRYKDKGEDYATVPWALRLPQFEIDNNVIDVTGKTGKLVVTMDARLLTAKDDILKAAKDAVTIIPAGMTPTQARFRAPASTELVRKLAGGDAVWIFVPVVPKLEAQAKEWLKSTDIASRVSGVQILQSFKSDANTTILKSLLEDKQITSDGKTRQYPVRGAAFDVLKQWRVEVARPVVEEPDGK
jgi:hypothetical protein